MFLRQNNYIWASVVKSFLYFSVFWSLIWDDSVGDVSLISMSIFTTPPNSSSLSLPPSAGSQAYFAAISTPTDSFTLQKTDLAWYGGKSIAFIDYEGSPWKIHIA